MLTCQRQQFSYAKHKLESRKGRETLVQSSLVVEVRFQGKPMCAEVCCHWRGWHVWSCMPIPPLKSFLGTKDRMISASSLATISWLHRHWGSLMIAMLHLTRVIYIYLFKYLDELLQDNDHEHFESCNICISFLVIWYLIVLFGTNVPNKCWCK